MADASSQLQLLQEKLRQAEQRAEQAEEKARRTTLEEFLEACQHLSQSISVQTDKSLSTQGSTTSPKGKCCPTILQPWLAFPTVQQEVFDTVYGVLHPPNDSSPRLFSPLLHIQELGDTMMGRKIASEADLRLFHSSAVENFVVNIVSVLARSPQCNRELRLGQGVTFENHTNTLSDLAEEVQAHLKSSASSDQPRRPPNPTYADQICVYKNEGGQTELLFIIEYKAPHKLTKEILRVGLRAMDLPTEVIHRAMIPTDLQEKYSYNADKLVAAALTQTYSYMLESGIEYSCIITGEAMVFLWVKGDESNTLYFHLAEPNEEVYSGDRLGFQHPRTAVGQLLSFCLLSFQSQRRSQQWRIASMKKAQTWTEDWRKILRDIPLEERKSEPPPSAYKARTYSINYRSPYYLRKRMPRPSSSSCSPEGDLTYSTPDDPAEGSGDGPESISTPSKKRPSTTRAGNRQRGTRGGSSAGSQHRPYCTQKCLLGLVQKSTLDQRCPNAGLHRQGEKGRTHLLNIQQFRDLVQRQLATDLDHNLKELKKQGIRGTLFQITLASHGYTFVGKATREVYVPAIQHEGHIYDRLQRLQGKMIPVYLGNIDLDVERPWCDLHVRLIHMLLMSWGGERVDKVDGVRDIEIEVERFKNRIERLGIRHNDLIPANMLWDKRIQSMIFIDFEAATQINGRALRELSNNRKRKREVEGETVDLEQRPSCGLWLKGD